VERCVRADRLRQGPLRVLDPAERASAVVLVGSRRAGPFCARTSGRVIPSLASLRSRSGLERLARSHWLEVLGTLLRRRRGERRGSAAPQADSLLTARVVARGRLQKESAYLPSAPSSASTGPAPRRRSGRSSSLKRSRSPWPRALRARRGLPRARRTRASR